MKIILISENGKRHARLSINLWLHVAAPLALMFFIASSSLLLLNKPSNPASLQSQLALGGLSENEKHDAFVNRTKYFGNIVRSSFNNRQYLKQTPGLVSPTSFSSNLSNKSVHLTRVPVDSGIVSSRFGFRRDPFNGKSRLHEGVDIAAKSGASIHTLASGFVTYTGRKGGYGKVIEIQHDKSLITRYAHLKNILVTQGKVVRKGDIIAKMGSTGRSTGPHLHLEVLKNGRNVDPELYFDGSLTGHQ